MIGTSAHRGRLVPGPSQGEPLLHRSIFDCLREQDLDERFTSTLLKNFRMNATLCRYPAAQIYVPEYQSATDEIAAPCLKLEVSETNPLMEAILDPSHPLVIGVLEGVQATAENVVEAEAVCRSSDQRLN